MEIHNTLPKKNETFWQFEVLPSIHILRVKSYGPDGDLLHREPGYTIIGFQWLFWSISFHFKDKT